MSETAFSDDAKMLMCGIFAFGRGTVKSHPPHQTYQSKQSAFQELLDRGLITKEPFNQFDIWLYKPTERLEEESGKHREWYWSKAFDKPDTPIQPLKGE